MTGSKLISALEDFLYLNDPFEVQSLISALVDEVFKSGLDESSLIYFEKKYTKTQKQELILQIFKEHERADNFKKINIKFALSSFLIDSNEVIQEEILPVFLKNLADKNNFKLVFTTLNILTSRWNELQDSMKKRIYLELLKILDNPHDIFIEEGIFLISKIVVDSKSAVDSSPLLTEREIKDFIRKIINIALKGKSGSSYAAIESITQFINIYPILINAEIYDSLFPLFKRLTKKMVLSYPAKRNFVKIAISFIKLMLNFEETQNIEASIINLKELMKKLASRINHVDAKYFLELILLILKSTNKLPKIEVIRPSFDIIRSLSRKKDRLEDFINELIDEILKIIWPMLDEHEKDYFFEETEFGTSVI